MSLPFWGCLSSAWLFHLSALVEDSPSSSCRSSSSWLTAASLTLYLRWATTPGTFVLFQPCLEMQPKGADLARTSNSITLRQGQTIGFLGDENIDVKVTCKVLRDGEENTAGIVPFSRRLRPPWGRESLLGSIFMLLPCSTLILCQDSSKWRTLSTGQGFLLSAASGCWWQWRSYIHWSNCIWRH